jgi:hypothetical protein
MKAMRRSHFIVLGNIVWFALFASEIAAVLAPDYISWWRNEGSRLRRSCDEDTFRFDLFDRIYLFGAIWLFSAPAMSIVALRVPERWPSQLSRFWWDRNAPGKSAATALAAAVLMLWPITGIRNAPVASMLLIEAGRLLALSCVALYYRAVLIST